MNDSANKITLSAGDLFNNTTAVTEEIQQIPIDMIHLPKNTPFKPYSESRMNELVESIERLGVLEPVLLRPRKTGGGYEVVAGANRTEASGLADKDTVPAIVRDMDDDTATLIMVDTNLKQRETLLPSEKAWAYRIMLEAMKRQGERTDLTSRQVVGKLESADIVGKNTSESGRQIQRYIRLTYLNAPLLDLIDNRELHFNVGVAVSYLKGNEQGWLCNYVENNDVGVSLAQANTLKRLSEQDKLTEDGMEAILYSEKQEPVKVTLKNKVLEKYFPANTTPKQMEEYIIKLLEKAKPLIKDDPIIMGNINERE